MRLATALCFQLAKPRVIKRELALKADAERQRSDAGATACEDASTLDRHHYADWRNDELDAQFRDHFDSEQLRGKAVLDFGCGTGYMSFLAARAGAASVDSVDLLSSDIETARVSLARQPDLPVRPEFRVAANEHSIEYPDQRFDIILCFDVVEHILAYRSILPEWKRVLKPGGRVLIWWQPFYHPYGHHLSTMIPLPWVHLVFSKRTLSETCDRIYALPEYQPRFWELDEDGRPLPRDDQVPEHLGGVNRLGIRGFERVCKESGLGIARREAHPFSGPKPVPQISKLLTRLPLLREMFTAYMIYELQNPA